MLTSKATELFRIVHFTLPPIIKPPFPTPSLKLVPNFSIISPIEREEIISHCFHLHFLNYEKRKHFFFFLMSTGLSHLLFCKMPVQILCLVCTGLLVLFIYKRSLSIKVTSHLWCKYFSSVCHLSLSLIIILFFHSEF